MKKEVLPGGVLLRDPFPSEDEFFKNRPEVAGMATDDGAVIVNPYAKLTKDELDAVKINEAARVLMATRSELAPRFELTKEQAAAFCDYGPIDAQKATIAARLLSGDPSGLEPTTEQMDFVEQLAQAMNIQVKHPIRRVPKSR